VEAVLPPHRVPGIFRQEKDENHRDIHEVTMDILNNQRERSFAEILLARLAHGAVWRVHPPRFVVSAPIVVAGNSKAAGSPQDQKRCRERQKCREPGRLRSKPRLSRTEKLWRVHGRKVRTEPVVFALKSGPGGIRQKGGKTQKHNQGLHPPGVRARGRPKPPLHERHINLWHKKISLSDAACWIPNRRGRTRPWP